MTEVFLRKYCPKCGGNIFLDRDCYGLYEKCLQCSYTRDLSDAVEVQEKVTMANHRTVSEKEP
jgi:reverse gyrase